ncbi:MAG: BON domain-containing protein [Isosphaeraceae bacterium]|nr:BON domain-containing protein [Isosphaeraceae bacterium]
MNVRHPAVSVRNPPAELAAEVEARVRRQLGGRVSDLRVVVRGGGLALQGRARTQHTRQLAQHAAMEATALPIVANEIRV